MNVEIARIRKQKALTKGSSKKANMKRATFHEASCDARSAIARPKEHYESHDTTNPSPTRNNLADRWAPK